jgi:protein SCO1/2
VARVAADGSYLRHWAGDTVLGPQAPPDAPVTWVSWFAARAYARWAGARLPSGAEQDLARQRGVGPAGGEAAPWEWVEDFNGTITSGESRGDGDPDGGLFCAGGAALATDPTNYAGFLRASFRASLRAPYALGALGFRLARDARPAHHHALPEGDLALPRGSLYGVPTTWTGADGRDVTFASLRGAPVVLAMVYFSCTMTCPVITAELQRVQALLPPEVRGRARFVLASFDSWRDSAPVLRGYAARMGLDPAWQLLAGPPDAVRTLAALVGVSYRRLPSGDFEHANVITVLDADGVLRHQERRIPLDRARLVAAIVAAARAPAP